ncbi:MAG: NYN domain-containing protein [Candidatus Kaiserbacteria bacterium]|nr:NYN domain-containing protein [Candidatus Kaiserbacteria bacterium]
MKKPRVGVFIDAGNLYHTSARIGWRIDFRKLRNLLSHTCDLSFINYHIIVPREDDVNYAKTLTHIQKASAAFTVCQKQMKYIWSDEEKREIKKGDIDVDLAVDVIERFENVDAMIVVSGDSDYLALEKYVAERGKPLIFMGYKKNMAWELRLKNHMFFELIREWVEYGITTNPDLSAGATLTGSIIAKAISESSILPAGVDNDISGRKRI